MRIRFAALYAALVVIANPIAAGSTLQIYSEPEEVLQTHILDRNGRKYRLGSSDIPIRVVNFWALSCAGCRREMPSLAAFDRHFSGRGLDVLTIATGRNDVAAAHAYFDENGYDNLPLFFDPRARLAREAGATATPYSIILNREGYEIGRIIGETNFMDVDLITELEELLVRESAS